LRIVFMGTPEFAVPVLSALHDAGHEIALVISQPDRPKGRGRKLEPTPVKQKALDLGLNVFQPDKIRKPEAIEAVAAIKPDLAVVAAFGQILPKAVLDIPTRGCLNTHASLLPAYRGAAPINWAIINGEVKTGVTIMQMDVGMDTGDMLLKAEEPILPDDTAGALTERLSKVGAALIVKAIEELEAGRLTPVKQDQALATSAPLLKKEMGLVDWNKPAPDIERLMRGLDPWPGAYTSRGGDILKLWKAGVAGMDADGEPGSVVDSNRDGIFVNTGCGVLVIKELQGTGGRRMTAQEYLAGHKITKGERLGQ
jgi:methionyl-tRNA formyltransferase